MTDFGKYGEPAFVGQYGDISSGKTVDAVLFDPAGWTFALPGAIKSSAWFLGPELYAYAQQMVKPIKNFDDLVLHVEAMAAGRMEPRTWRADDVSVLVETTLHRLRTEFTKSNSYSMWDALAALADRLKVAAKQIPAHGIAGFHLDYPKTDEKGRFHKGGPASSGPKAMKVMASVMDVLYKAEYDATMFPFPRVYRCEVGHPQWHYKDRHNVIMGVAPMNMREAFRAADLRVPRFPGMEWMDTVADDVAAAVTGGNADKRREVFEKAVKMLVERNVYIGHAYWAAQDGIHREAFSRRSNPFTHAISAASGSGGLGSAIIMPPTTTSATK